MAEYDEFSANGGRIRWAEFGDWGLEDKGARWEEFADGGSDGLAFPFGLAGVLKAKVVHAGGCKEVGDVSDAVS